MRHSKSTLFILLLLVGLINPAVNAASGPSDSRTVFQVGPGFQVSGASAIPGVGVGAARRLSAKMPLYLGIESGVFFNTIGLLTFQIPILPMVFYRFPINAEIVPTLGMGLGPLISFGGFNRVEFMMMINPGFQFYLDTDMDLFFRSSLGIIGSSFAFYPQIGATFRM